MGWRATGGEAQTRKPAREGRGPLRRPSAWAEREHVLGVCGVVGDGMERSEGEVNQGSRAGSRNGVHGRRPEEPCPEGDRALVRATKRGNARGAKGGREMESGHPGGGRNRWRSALQEAVRASDQEVPSSPGQPPVSEPFKEWPAPALHGQGSFQRSDTITGKPHQCRQWQI